MGWLDELGRGARAALVLAATGALVVVALLNGACSQTPPSGHCWRPGICRHVSSSAECDGSESFSEGRCSTLLQVGACVGTDGYRVRLYAPLHGLLPPNCESYTGPGSTFDPVVVE